MNSSFHAEHTFAKMASRKRETYQNSARFMY